MKLFRALSAVAIAALTAVVPVAPAGAADNVVVRKVDTSDYPNVKLTVLKPPVAGANEPVRISENGRAITDARVQTFAQANEPVGVALLIDTSTASQNGDALTKQKDAAVAMVQAKQPNQKFAVIAFNNTPRPVVNFTDNAGLLIDGINKLQASGEPALWDGIRMGAALFAEQPGLQPNIVILTGAADARSNANAESASSAARSAKSVVFPVVIRQREAVNSESLQSLAAETGGRYIETTDPSVSTEILAGLQRNLQEQVLVTYRSPGAKVLDIEVGVGTGVATVHASPGTVAQGAEVAPQVVAGSSLPPFLRGYPGLILVALVSLAGVGLLVYGVVEIVSSDRNQLSRALRPYSDEPEEGRDLSKLADSQIIKKAVAQTAQFAKDRGFLETVQQRLEQADLPLRPAEAMFFTAVGALIAMIVGLVAFGVLGLAGAGLLFAYLPIAVTSIKAKRRRKKFQSQLPDTLQLLSGSLRAGYSLVQGLDAVSKQCEAPMGTELTRAMSEARLGRPVEEALQEVSDRMGSDDFEWAVMAIRIQREVGGNLAELLVTVADTMIERERLRREVKALTAEGRISAIVLVALPPSIGGLITLMNPAYMDPLFSNVLGQYAIVAATFMMGIGYWLMNKLIEIDV